LTKVTAGSLGDMFMEEMDPEPEQHAESLPKTEKGSQKEIVEEPIFHPVQLSTKTEEDESEIEVEQKLQELLKDISEVTLQLREFLTEENRLMNELCVSIKQIMKKLGVSFDIPPRNIRANKKIKRVILNEEGHLTFYHEKGEAHSAFLAEYPPEIVIAVLWTVMPKLAKVVATYRKKIRSRISLFKKLKTELKTIAKAVVGTKD
jgi:sucrose-6-phosphate hydrolase SacC (GH32 family)